MAELRFMTTQEALAWKQNCVQEEIVAKIHEATRTGAADGMWVSKTFDSDGVSYSISPRRKGRDGHPHLPPSLLAQRSALRPPSPTVPFQSTHAAAYSVVANPRVVPSRFPQLKFQRQPSPFPFGSPSPSPRREGPTVPQQPDSPSSARIPALPPRLAPAVTTTGASPPQHPLESRVAELELELNTEKSARGALENRIGTLQKLMEESLRLSAQRGGAVSLASPGGKDRAASARRPVPSTVSTSAGAPLALPLSPRITLHATRGEKFSPTIPVRPKRS